MNRCDSRNDDNYGCSLVMDHDGDHEAYEDHDVLGALAHSWPQQTVPDTFSALDALEETLQRRSDDIRDAAAAAGEALERTKGLQVPDILRRLTASERRLSGLESAAVHSPVTPGTTTDGRLLTAVNELTTVMRELVRQNAKPAPPALPTACGNQSYGLLCDLAPGHDGMHERGIFAWLTGYAPDARLLGQDELRTVCGVTRSRDDSEYPCVREQGHSGDHRDADGYVWPCRGHKQVACTAVLRLGRSEFACTAPVGHPGDHLDAQGDLWQIVDRP